MERTPGSRIGPYEIVGALGAGGMGEVYRARDAKLDRQVAIKILPPAVADDPERRARFEREARALASLNHPHIAQIYGVEDAAGAMAIVMELVEGEDLAARIARAPLPWRDAQPIARQLVAALDAAHERGIVHRDLKPANIRITPGESVKVLDFGLAKALTGSDSGLQDPSLSPTFTSPGTHLGTIIGTAAYMAPEQAKGKAVDKRTDIWAFGCVLFEMLTGHSPFASATAVESLGLALTKEPEWSALPSATPPRIVELLRRCLAKDPKHRLRDIGDAAFVIDEPGSDAASSPVPDAGASRRSLALVALLGLALAAIAGAAAWQLKPAPPLPLRRLELPAALAASNHLVISPDGTRLAYFSEGRLLVRALDETAPRNIADAPPTSDRIFWSPDSRTIGYVAQATIRTVPADGGPLFTVCRVPGIGRVLGIAWRADNTIVFSSWRDSLYKVSPSGGTPEALLTLERKTEIDFHEIYPGRGNTLLVAVHLRDPDAVRTELLDGDERRPFISDPTPRDFRYVDPGYLMFRRVGANQGLWVLPWTDAPPDLAKAILVEAGATHYSAASDGTLVIRSQAPRLSRLFWVTRNGATTTTTSIPGAPIPEMHPLFALAPGGDRIVFVENEESQSNRIVVRDLSTGVDTRVSQDQAAAPSVGATDQFVLYPDWFPSGDRVLYAHGPVETSKIVSHRADGAGGRVEIGPGMLARISADAKWLVWLEDDRGQGRLHFSRLSASGQPEGPRQTFPGVDSQDIRTFDLSTDGRLIAYTVRDPTGQSNIYLSDFPAGTARWQVTTNGGNNPRFSSTGGELFYASGTRSASGRPEGLVMVLPVTVAPSVKLGVPRVLLSGDNSANGFDVARDGRLLVAKAAADAPATRAVLVQNWPALLERQQ